MASGRSKDGLPRLRGTYPREKWNGMEERLEPEKPETSSVEPPGKKSTPPEREGWLSRHSKAITAWTAIGSFITTAVLAVFAYYSLSEVRKQRELAFKQFVVANAPSVQTYAAEGFRFEKDYAVMIWRVVNKGGPVNDVVYKSLVVCCSDDMKEVSDSKVILRSPHVDRLNRTEASLVKILVVNDGTTKWLKDPLEGKKDRLFLYIQTEYTIPPELSIAGKERRERTYRLCVWDPRRNGFEDTKPEYEKLLLRLIEERGYLRMDDRG